MATSHKDTIFSSDFKLVNVMTSTKSPSESASPHPPVKRFYQILAGKLFDPLTRRIASNQVINIDRDLGIVLDVKSELEVEGSDNEFGQNVEITKIDLRHLVILPGLVDVHVHCELSFFFAAPFKFQVDTGDVN